MARITVEDSLEKVSNRFELVILASKRAKTLQGGEPASETENLEFVTALRKIAAGKIRGRRSDAVFDSRTDSRNIAIAPPSGDRTS